MPSMRVEVDLGEFCNVKDLQLVVGHALLSADDKIRQAAESINQGLELDLSADKNPAEPDCDRKYRRWLKERLAVEKLVSGLPRAKES